MKGMSPTENFAQGMAYALQVIYDFERKHGHLELDTIAAITLNETLKGYAIAFNKNRFEVVKCQPLYERNNIEIKH